MGRKEDNIQKAQLLMDKPDFIRNIGIAAHIDHGKTTLSDNLIAGAGMMSEEQAGKQLVLDFDEQEQARGITINAANASMVHDYKGKEYLINLIDTPGHVDFGGDVTRAMRAVDGCVIVVCASEGAMPQTETVVRQALREKVKPVLFVNKVDRLINELQLNNEQMMEKFTKVISKVNQLIKKFAPKEYKKEWQVKVEDGTVAFGSAKFNWAINVPFMKKSGITFKDIYDHLSERDQVGLAKKSPIHEILLNMIIDHLPSPTVAQAYRIPHIWHGDKESEIGKGMISMDPKSPTVFMATKIIMDKHAGEIATGRLYGGSIKRGDELFVIGGSGKAKRIQQVGVFVGPDRISVDTAIAGNIIAVTGMSEAISGSTITADLDMEPFERIIHVSEPVVTKAIEAKFVKDLPKLVELLRSVAKSDPSIQVEINQETGEHLMSGMGELHLEITEHRIVNEHGIEITASPPIVVYRECVEKKAEAFEGKSPNKHNRFYIEVEPLEPKLAEALRDGTIPEGRIKNPKELSSTLVDLGYSKDEAKKLIASYGGNAFFDVTKGIQYLHETRELIYEAFVEVIKKGPLCDEPVRGMRLSLVDAKLHEDNIHRGPAQVIPAVRNAIKGAMMTAGPTLLEPKQQIYINIPDESLGAVTRELNQRRASIDDMEAQDEQTTVISKAPVSELFGFAGAIRSATAGKAIWNTEFAGFEIVPRELLTGIVKQIRSRKGLPEDPYGPSYYAG